MKNIDNVRKNLKYIILYLVQGIKFIIINATLYFNNVKFNKFYIWA